MIHFTVYGIPQPAGSKNAFHNKKTGQTMVVDTNKNAKPWKLAVAASAREVYDGPLLSGALELTVIFTMPRPKHHYGTGRNRGRIKCSAPKWHIKKPDTTKLLRCLEDGLTKIVWFDDSQVVKQTCLKKYGDHTGAEVVIKKVED